MTGEKREGQGKRESVKGEESERHRGEAQGGGIWKRDWGDGKG